MGYNIQPNLKNIGYKGRGMDASGSEEGRVAECCQKGNAILGCAKCVEFHD
jgi:hypothetical protein